MHFGEYQNTMCYFKYTSHAIWMPMGKYKSSDSDVSSKGSSRYYIRPSLTSSTRLPLKYVVENQAEEEIFYHVMTVARALLSEHEGEFWYF